MGRRRPLVTLLALATCAARPVPGPRGEEPFDPARARAEVGWLADPARTGRGVGTPGGEAASAWIADRFREAGLAPALEGGYLQRFEAPHRATLGERNRLAVGGVPAVLPGDWLPLGSSDDGVVEAEVVWAGHGITAPDLGYDDHAGLDVKGKVVLVAQDSPREAAPASAARRPGRRAPPRGGPPPRWRCRRRRGALADGDLDLYKMRLDGSGLVRLTSTPGYDGGAFFSADGKRIVFRASRPETEAELAEYRALLAQRLVRPRKLEIYTMNADGSDVRQVTRLGAASFAPFFHPDGRRIIFASNVGDPTGRNFDLYLVNDDGTGLERITTDETFDGFPMFSPDGKKLVFSSNRNGSRPHETNVFVSDWVE
ncbi:MAG TPA: hypothetical protein VML50_08500 [Anaeromyxobacter sp.]|nr:hypothetical protein [Anaeromyxobacter sp.]